MSEQAEKKSFKSTLNLPKTTFNMKANLVQNEPASQKRWAEQKLYQQLRDAGKGKPRYVFHDGPPYANGSIHLGHLLNKVLKDLVVRTKTMAGFDVPYIPGWDCHGLPIEHKVMLELGDKARDMVALQIRKRCQDYAAKFIKLQMGQMQRLLTIADYDNPYLTMAPDYEAAVLEVFADLVGKGLVYRALKPVHWSIANQTALAEAELEYEDREDTSVYVLFEMDESSRDGLLDEFVGEESSLHKEPPEPPEPVHLMIWTTTPWTLPANLAVAVHDSYRYALVRMDGRLIVLAEDLAEKVAKIGGVGKYEFIAHVEGFNLAGMKYKHPFVENCPPGNRGDEEECFRIVTADYVTLEDGTGMVHTAPGHGVEDYQTGLRYKLPIYCPVQADGTFDQTAPQWLQGKSVWEANNLVIERLRESGHLFFAHPFSHSYPHDWRSKTPVIFRATEQWFLGVDLAIPGATTPGAGQLTGPAARTDDDDADDSTPTLRNLALRETESDVKFIPEWGRNRMRGMLESRPDWCLSRQRSWGLPIPAFFGPNSGDFLLTKASILAVSEVVRKHGSDAWYKLEAHELLADYDSANDADAPAWVADALSRKRLEKATDIFDVWFESGSSWAACIRTRGLGHDTTQQPITDLYLEGSDQHRGWFQSSLLPGIGATGRSPFKNVLTHGFMVDKDGKKMSKSLGNTLEVEALMKDYGADVCRWWVATLNTDNDIKVDKTFFDVAGEAYRKVRNTIRFLLSNLGDYEKPRDSYPWALADATSLDAWAMSELNKLIKLVRDSYEKFQFRRASEAIFDFCNETMSAVYLAATKDRLYCDAPGSARRRRTQTAMFEITSALIRLIAPIQPHTADEAWAALHKSDVKAQASVHLELFPEPVAVTCDADWAAVIEARDAWLKFLEESRKSSDIENPLDMGLAVPASDALKKFARVDLADLCGISRLALVDGAKEMKLQDLRSEPRCERSWKRDGTVKPRSDGSVLSDRDAAALGLA
ncbi:MAG: isoleucine--tRNA ligase [Phycisphaeraceae bacterium]